MKKRLLIAIIGLAVISPVWAQDSGSASPDDEKGWSGSFGAGLSLTSGNTDTATYNLTLDGLYDPQTRNIFKFGALYLRGDENDNTTVDRMRFFLRDEYILSEKAFVFGEFDYLRDPFKEISYLLNPKGGLGYKMVDTELFYFDLTGALGGVWEKNPGFEVAGTGSVNAGQRLAYRFSDTAELTQSLGALWKMDDFGDAFYTFAAGIAASITTRTQMKVQFLNDYQHKPPTPDTKKNDTAFVVSFVYGF